MEEFLFFEKEEMAKLKFQFWEAWQKNIKVQNIMKKIKYLGFEIKIKPQKMVVILQRKKRETKSTKRTSRIS